ncbi:MAG TPA: tRNA (adenosine(37)-N6)-threonylcarbamoyltransferase complex dimerization subunit type 1 TsaB [Gemmatimonadaceae bacterium]
MIVLALDAATYSGSVALIREGKVSAEAVVAMRGEREERLMPAIANLLSGNGVTVDDLEAVACGAGPGSFTSLRIAAAIAKGICAAKEIPLLVAPSPLLVVSGAIPVLQPGEYIVALDAMRGDYFCQEVSVFHDQRLLPGESWRTSRDDLVARASDAGRTIVGPKEANAMTPHARGFSLLIEQGTAFRIDMTSWEPDYGRKAEAQVRWEASHGRPLGEG